MKSKINFTFLLIFFTSTFIIAQCDITPTIVNLPTIADTNSGPISITGSPAGGVFSGNGILFNAFNPILAGPGIHEITYTYTDPATDCVYEATDNILILTISDAWVSYHLGTISPKLSIPEEIFIEQFGNYDVFIADLSGRILYQDNIEFSHASQLHQFNEINLPVGQYVATFRNRYHSFSKQVVLGR